MNTKMQIGIILQKVIIFLFQFAVLMWCILASAYIEILPFDILFVIYYIVVFVPAFIYAYFYRRIYRMTGLYPEEFKRLDIIVTVALATIINLKYWSLTSELIHDFFAGMFK